MSLTTGGGSMYGNPSRTSMIDMSEPISEVDEINELRALKRIGEKALKKHRYQEALEYITEALRMDDKHPSLLALQTTALLGLDRNMDAQTTALELISLSSNNAQGYYLNGISLKNLGRYHEALDSFLTALHLDPGESSQLTNQIAVICVAVCDLHELQLDKLKDMNIYKKLVEIGVHLYNNREYQTCVNVLETAQQFQTNQKGITMRLLLTLADAYSVLKHAEQSIGFYQECCSVAVSVHDYLYQTKSLVNIACLYLELRDTHQAIVNYEKLLDLQETLIVEYRLFENFPDFWTLDLRCGIHLNLSIAYKAIGNMETALTHAKQYLQLLLDNERCGYERAEAYHNVGVLHEILDHFHSAAECYQMYYKDCRRLSNKKGLGQAYGCLGSVYAHLRNWPVSITYHEQYIAVANKSQDKRLIVISNEMLGDTLMLKSDYEEAKCRFEVMLKESPRTDYRSQAMAKCKIANACIKLGQREYALHYYDSAKDLAEEMSYDDIVTLCEYNIADTYKTSTQPSELDQARKYFEKLIPQFEWKLRQYNDEGTFCSPEFLDNTRNCYNGLLQVLSQVGNKDCLMFAEALNLESPGNVMKSAIVPKHDLSMDLSSSNIFGCSIETLNRTVSEQNAVVIYFKVLSESFMLWLIEPFQGITSFYIGRSVKRSTEPLLDEMKRLIREFHAGYNARDILNLMESRAIPLDKSGVGLHGTVNTSVKNDRIDPKSRENVNVDDGEIKTEIVSKISAEHIKITSPTNEDIGVDVKSKVVESEDNVGIEKTDKMKQKVLKSKQDDNTEKTAETNENMYGSTKRKKVEYSVYKRLYHILFGSIDEVLSNLPDNSPVVIVPDDFLWDIPFGFLQDWHSRPLNSRLRITYVSNLALLQKTTVNELNRLAEIHDIDSGRKKILHGGFSQLLKNSRQSFSASLTDMDRKSEERIKSIQVSNPRLLKTIGYGLINSESSDSQVYSKCVRFNGRNLAVSDISRMDRRVYEQACSSRKHMLHLAKIPVVMNKAKDSLNTLTCVTSTKTDITTSKLMVPEYKQIAYMDRCVVIGNPVLPQSIELPANTWNSVPCLRLARSEMDEICSFLDTPPISADVATKERFMREAITATVLHIVTYASLQHGYLLFTPNVNGPTPSSHSYLVSPEEIVDLKLRAQLVVLSCGWGASVNKGDPHFLANLFLAAGAECVVMTRWPVINDVTSKFFYHFYTCLQTGSYVSSAISHATQALREDNRFSDPYNWTPFLLIGKDVHVNIGAIRHAQLDLDLNIHEDTVQEWCSHDLLNRRVKNEHLKSKEYHVNQLQKCLAQLLIMEKGMPNPIIHLIDIIDSALKRLQSHNNQLTDVLPYVVAKHQPSIQILRLLWFDFQVGEKTTDAFPYIVYPHWNVNDLLVPVYDALRSVYELSEDHELAHVLYNMLPLGQNLISLLIDVLCITRHAPDIKLKISDISVRPLWKHINIRALLTSIGYHHIGPIINFKYSPRNKQLLTCTLQLLLAMSCHKSSVLLHKLDVNLLGKPAPKQDLSSSDLHRLPSLAPLLLHRNQLTMAAPWMTNVEDRDEMLTKIKLADSKGELDKDHEEYFFRTKSWHRMALLSQKPKANSSLEKYGRSKTPTSKVKKSLDTSNNSADASPNTGIGVNQQNTDTLLSVNQQNSDGVLGVNQKRVSTHDMLDRQFKGLMVRHDADVKHLYLPYISSR